MPGGGRSLFLEDQPEVDPSRLGFTGYSMGGNITSFAAIDPRLRAVAPMVGGTGFVTSPFPGIPDPVPAGHLSRPCRPLRGDDGIAIILPAREVPRAAAHRDQ